MKNCRGFIRGVKAVPANPPAERLLGKREAAEGLMGKKGGKPASVVEMRAGCEQARKFGRNDLGSLPMRLTAKERRLLEKLFDEIVLPFDDLFDGSVNRVLGSLNTKFRRVLGENAVFGRTLQGSSPRGGTFYWLELNLDLFDARKRTPKPGKHYNLKDVFTPLQLKVIDCLKKRGCCTIRALAGELRVRESAVRSQVCWILGRECRKRKLPLAIEKNGRNPTGYCLSEKFVSHFGLNVVKRVGLNAFSGRQREVLLFLAESPDRTAREIGARVGCDRTNALEYVRRINERAGALGAKAIETHFVRRTMRFRLSEAIDFGEVKVEKKRELQNYFSEKQAEAIEFVAAHPYSTMSEIAVGLGISEMRVKSRLGGIQRSASKNNLPSVLVRIDARYSRYSISPEFAALFGLEAVAESPKSFLTPALYAVYVFFKKTPSATTAEASEKLGILTRTVAQHVGKINILLQERGLETVSYKHGASSNYKNPEGTEEYRVACRKEKGKWPAKLEKNRSARNRAWEKLSKGEQRELVSRDWARIERANALARFDGAGKIVEREVLSALWRGASAARILEITKRNENAGRTMRALENA